MNRRRIFGIVVLGAMIPAGLLMAAHGGGGKPGGGAIGGGGVGGTGQGGMGQGGMGQAGMGSQGGMGPGSNFQNRAAAPVDPAVQAQKTRDKISKIMSDGFADLKAGDSADALDAFSDTIQLQPDNPLAHLGMGLARAQKRQYSASETEFTIAAADAKRAKANLKPDPKADPKTDSPEAFQADMRLANYDLGVTFVRLDSKPRALVLFDKLIAEPKPTDEILVNAQRSVLATFNAKALSAIAAMPAMLKTLHAADTSLISLHAPLRRWGVTWMADADAGKHYTAGEIEPLPKELPFLMPGDELLPELGPDKKPIAVAANPLAPVIADDVQVAAGPAPDPAGGAAPVPPPPVDAPAQPANPANPAPPVVADAGKPADAPTPITRTVNGAAFAVAPDLLLTCSRLTTGAKTLAVQGTDGVNYPATLVDADDANGVALIKVEGGHFKPMALADTAASGSVHIPAFVRPGVFAPQLEVLSGILSVSGSSHFLHVSIQPRSAGSPLVDEKGKVVGILTATRDDPLGRLPVVAIDLIRKFASGKFTAVTEAATIIPDNSVLELSATREE